MQQFNHIGLFEGIGGFALAARYAGWHTPVMVEWNKYCQAVLKKNFPDAEIYGDIHGFNALKYRGWVDIITGGFPCQPVSGAGLRRGVDDDRWLWPEMFRVIKECQPAWVIGENVAGLISMDGGRVLRSILADLESEGYSVEIYNIPAIGLAAPHIRERIWIVAQTPMRVRCVHGSAQQKENPFGRLRNTCTGDEQRVYSSAGFTDADDFEQNRAGRTRGGRIESANGDSPFATDANNQRCDWRSDNKGKQKEERNGFKADCFGNFTHPSRQGLQGRHWRPSFEQGTRAPRSVTECHCAYGQDTANAGLRGWSETHEQNDLFGWKPDTDSGDWNQHWHEVATRICRVDDGVPTGMDTVGTIPAATANKEAGEKPKRKTSGRAHRIEALGNSIVWPIAYQFFTAINSTNHV